MRDGDFKYWLIQLCKQRKIILISLQRLSLMQKFYDYFVCGTLGFIIPTQPEWTIKERNQNKENILNEEMLMSWVTPSFSTYKSCASWETSQKQQAHITGAAHEQSVWHIMNMQETLNALLLDQELCLCVHHIKNKTNLICANYLCIYVCMALFLLWWRVHIYQAAVIKYSLERDLSNTAFCRRIMNLLRF